MNFLFGASNALNKWLGEDLPRLPTEPGKQAGVNTLVSNAQTLSWQVHLVDNRYQSVHKTIIACEANSRFTLFLPTEERLILNDLTDWLQIEWRSVLAETLEVYPLIRRGEIAMLLNQLAQVKFDKQWVKNTDLSVNGHIADAGL